MWAPVVQILIGVWLILTPSVFSVARPAADNLYIMAPLLITFAVIALWEINKSVVKVNILIGGWLLLAPLFLEFGSRTAVVSEVLSALAVIALSLVRRNSQQRFGGGWRSLFQANPEHLEFIDDHHE